MISGIGKHENDMHCISARYTCKDKSHCGWSYIQLAVNEE
jgi:hypothetical protein